VEALVRALIDGQRRLAVAAGPVIVRDERAPGWLKEAEDVHIRVLAGILDRTGATERLATSESGDVPGAILGRIGILANAIDRHVNAFDDAGLEASGLQGPLEGYLGTLNSLIQSARKVTTDPVS
jgi:hypothetical protein